MPITCTVEPTVQPVTLEEIRDHCGITDLEDNARLVDLIDAATRYVEGLSRKALITQTWRETCDNFPGSIITLRRRPLQSVTHVKYYDNGGNQQTVSSGDYDVDTDADPGRIVLGYSKTWPVCRGHTNDIEIVYVAGYGDAPSNVPDSFRQAIKLLVSHGNESREAVLLGTISKEIELGVKSLLMLERDYAFG